MRTCTIATSLLMQLTLVVVLLITTTASAFTPPVVPGKQLSRSLLLVPLHLRMFREIKPSENAISISSRCPRYQDEHRTKVIATFLASVISLLVPGVAMSATEVEMADLPPPWIPVVFGLGLVVVSLCGGNSLCVQIFLVSNCVSNLKGGTTIRLITTGCRLINR
jgi:hypothetical protein